MMSEDLAALRRKLDDLSRRLDARTREFAQTGEFSDVHEALISQIRQGTISLERRWMQQHAKVQAGIW